MQVKCQMCNSLVTSNVVTMNKILSFIIKCGMHILHTMQLAPLNLCIKVLCKLPINLQMHILKNLYTCTNCCNKVLSLCRSVSYSHLITLAGCPMFTANDKLSCMWRNTVNRLMLKETSGNYDELVAISLLKRSSSRYADFAAQECNKYFTIHKSYKYMVFIVINKIPEWDAREIWSVVRTILMLKFACTRKVKKYVVRYHPGGPNWSYNKWSVKNYYGIGNSRNAYIYIVHPNRIKLVPICHRPDTY